MFNTLIQKKSSHDKRQVTKFNKGKYDEMHEDTIIGYGLESETLPLVFIPATIFSVIFISEVTKMRGLQSKSGLQIPEISNSNGYPIFLSKVKI